MYSFYLDDMLLPVTPGALKVAIQNKNEVITLINEGEAGVLKRPGLSTIRFDALLPNKRYPFARYAAGFQGAEYYLSKLEALKTGLRPFVFRVIRTGAKNAALLFDQTFKVSLEDYTIEEDAENYGADVQVSVKLRQYEARETKIVFWGDNTAQATETRDTSGKPQETTYTVASWDSLWKIAQVQLGDGMRWPEIYALNEAVIEEAARAHGRESSSRGQWIYVGTVLRLPG